jgi:hypothetical protein
MVRAPQAAQLSELVASKILPVRLTLLSTRQFGQRLGKFLRFFSLKNSCSLTVNINVSLQSQQIIILSEAMGNTYRCEDVAWSPGFLDALGIVGMPINNEVVPMYW